MPARSWADDAAFVAALEARRYILRNTDQSLCLVMSDGIYLYLYELYLDGVRDGQAGRPVEERRR